MKRGAIYTEYKSTIDRLLMNYDKRQPLSDAQKCEREKYQRIYFLRDHASLEPKNALDVFFTKE